MFQSIQDQLIHSFAKYAIAYFGIFYLRYKFLSKHLLLNSFSILSDMIHHFSFVNSNDLALSQKHFQLLVSSVDVRLYNALCLDLLLYSHVLIFVENYLLGYLTIIYGGGGGGRANLPIKQSFCYSSKTVGSRLLKLCGFYC